MTYTRNIRLFNNIFKKMYIYLGINFFDRFIFLSTTSILLKLLITIFLLLKIKFISLILRNVILKDTEFETSSSV